VIRYSYPITLKLFKKESVQYAVSITSQVIGFVESVEQRLLKMPRLTQNQTNERNDKLFLNCDCVRDICWKLIKIFQ